MFNGYEAYIINIIKIHNSYMNITKLIQYLTLKINF
jgi:hypothetical protein